MTVRLLDAVASIVVLLSDVFILAVTIHHAWKVHRSLREFYPHRSMSLIELFLTQGTF